jgi:hypothetical protein
LPSLLHSLQQETLGLFAILLLCLVLIMATPVSSEAEAPSARDSVRRLVAFTLLLLAGVGLLNLLVNPFGSYASRLLDPIVLSSRQKKLELYERRRPPPSVVIMGSSRSFTMSPAYVEARTRRAAFNASVQVAGPRDYLGLARYLAARRSLPQVFLVGLGVEQLVFPAEFVEDDDPWEAYLSADETRSSRARWRYGRLFTIEEMKASFRVLALELRGRPAPLVEFDADGLTHLRGVRSPVEQALDESLAGSWRPAIFSPEALQPAPLAHLRQFLDLSRQRQTRVVIYLPPYHPRATARYSKESHFPSLRAQLLALLASWQGEYSFKLHDLTELSSFGGGADMFYDASHPTEDASRLMIDAMLVDLS